MTARLRRCLFPLCLLFRLFQSGADYTRTKLCIVAKAIVYQESAVAERLCVQLICIAVENRFLLTS